MRSQTLLVIGGALSAASPIVSAFITPTPFQFQSSSSSSTTTSSSKLSLATDPSSLLLLHDVPQHVDTLQHFFSSLTLADMDVNAMSSALDAAPGGPDAAAAVTSAAAAADTTNNGGWFGFLTLPIESLLQFLHGTLSGVGLVNAWGVSIILMTMVIKLATFPLTKTQLEGTNKMQVSLHVVLCAYMIDDGLI